MNAAFLLAVSASGMVGAPLASSLLELQGWLGLSGWQWMFVLEGLPSVVLGIAVFRLMPDRPADAAWLDAGQRRWLEARLDLERSTVEAAHGMTGFWRGLTDARVAWLCVVYFAFGTATYGMIYFMPLFIKNWGLSNLATGWTVAVPEAVGVVGMLAWGHWSDRTLERRRNLSVALLLASLGLAGMALYGGSAWSLAAAAMVVVGVNAGRPLFWALPATFLSRSAMASALALISCCANFGGMTGTVVIGWIKDATGGFGGGLLYMSALMAVAAVIVLWSFRSMTPSPKPLAVA